MKPKPIYIIGLLALLAGWHLDARDAALMDRHAAELANIPTPPPVLDNPARLTRR